MSVRPHVSIADACTAIVAMPAPVLMLDTCTLLDVARAPLRGSSSTIVPTIDLVKLATQSPKGIHVVLSYTVEDEWDRNINTIVAEVRNHIRNIRKSLLSLRTACTPLSIPLPAELATHVDPLAEHLNNLAKQLYDSGLVLGRDEDSCRRAVTRLHLGEPPAKRGESSSGDCLIVEHCLALCRSLRAARFAHACVFVSSNTNDYCSGSRGLHKQLAAEFQAIELQFARNLGEARSLLGV
jgi:PIN domain